jgi:hypothetical protein
MESRRSLDRFTVAVQRIAERAPGVLRLRVYIIKTSFRFRYSFATYTQLPVVPGSNEALKRYEATGLSVKARWLIEYGCF